MPHLRHRERIPGDQERLGPYFPHRAGLVCTGEGRFDVVIGAVGLLDGANVDHAIALLSDEPPGDLRYLDERLTDALRDALRIADSRGRRLNDPDQP
ncbi:hypothetical protein AB0D89_02840 [Streptomyces luteogriseus]|uniref:hypothetical protein n=1 Tax=Streptomyces luteogriseus TaxID=68233 RepID=UPI0033F68A90